MENNQNKNGGALFKNDKKLTEQHPDYTGTLTIEGKDYYLSAWVNESARTGQKYFAIKATPKVPATPTAATTVNQSPTTTPTVADPVDDLPF
jgi:hypothetical protein